MKCFTCGEDHPRRALVTRSVIDTYDDGLGYDEIEAKICRSCDLKRNGTACEVCGELHRSVDDAHHCCSGPEHGEAPDCIECGRRMTVTVQGYDPVSGPEVTVAECDCCPVMWGAFTGWEHADGEPCKHVETDPRGEAA